MPYKSWAASLRFLPLVFLVAGVARAERLPEPVPQGEYAARRKALAERLRLDYLTGTEIPNTALVLIFDRPAGTAEDSGQPARPHYAEYFYLPERDPGQERWTGPKAGAGALENDSRKPDAD